LYYDLDELAYPVDKDLLYTCPFKFEKSKRPGVHHESSSSSEDINLAELADFNKIMERNLKAGMSKEFHEKFHTINKLQNKEIDNKLKILSKQRNVGQLKYSLKKRVHDIKNNMEDIKIHLGRLDEDLEK
jgi:hypothetical protein